MKDVTVEEYTDSYQIRHRPAAKICQCFKILKKYKGYVIHQTETVEELPSYIRGMVTDEETGKRYVFNIEVDVLAYTHYDFQLAVEYVIYTIGRLRSIDRNAVFLKQRVTEDDQWEQQKAGG